MAWLKLLMISFVPTEFEDNDEQLPPETEQMPQKLSTDSASYKEESKPTGWPCSAYNLSYLASIKNCMPSFSASFHCIWKLAVNIIPYLNFFLLKKFIME